MENGLNLIAFNWNDCCWGNKFLDTLKNTTNSFSFAKFCQWHEKNTDIHELCKNRSTDN